MHEQLISSVLPRSDSELGGHALHGTDPVAFFHVDLGQGRHNSFDTPKSVDMPKPARQEQLVEAELPAGDIALGVHTRHDNRVVEPIRVEYVPCSHKVHAAEPFNSLYVPAPHAEHASPFAPV
jgi:hypothetical protein